MIVRRLQPAGALQRLSEVARYVPPALLRTAWWRVLGREPGWGVFNGQHARRAAVDRLIELFRPNTILETGAFYGSTAAYLAREGLPVFTVELQPRYAAVARRQLGRFDHVTLLCGDSVAAIRTLLAEGSLDRPFVYLDAHWENALPLRGEADALLRGTENSLLVVDDFLVPGDDGYGYDTYHGRPLDLAVLNPPTGAILAYPAVPSAEETGERRGTLYVGHGPDAKSAMQIVIGEGLLRPAAPESDRARQR